MSWTDILTSITGVLTNLAPLFIGLITAFGLYIFGPKILAMWGRLISAVKSVVK